jgi:branched-chain amino acid transport system ATP-binding protein
MLEVDRINTYYGEFQALKEVSLNVKEGELVIVFGPNGHGKSTLLKTICGLLTPSSGYVKFDGKQINGMPTQKIVGMGMVYIAEDRHLFPDMTVLENLKLGAYTPHARTKEAENLDYVFHLFPKLKDWRKRNASTLSGGEARMLAIGRGLMSAARFLAIDEPSLGLAPIVRHDVFTAIKEINERGISVLMVEQSVVQISEMVDRTYLMEDGRIVFEGSKDEALKDEHVKEVFLGVCKVDSLSSFLSEQT